MKSRLYPLIGFVWFLAALVAGTSGWLLGLAPHRLQRLLVGVYEEHVRLGSANSCQHVAGVEAFEELAKRQDQHRPRAHDFAPEVDPKGLADRLLAVERG